MMKRLFNFKWPGYTSKNQICPALKTFSQLAKGLFIYIRRINNVLADLGAQPLGLNNIATFLIIIGFDDGIEAIVIDI